MTKNAVTIGCCALLALVVFSGAAWAQVEGPVEKGRDGVFEITLKGTEPPRTMTVDELVRDRDLLPGYLFRVKAGGFLAFDESEWVDKIEFKVYEQPVTELSEYRRFATLLQDINAKISEMKQVLGQHDQLAMRMMDMCGRVRYPTLQAIDEDIAEQLGKYRQLILLRGLVINSLHRFHRGPFLSGQIRGLQEEPQHIHQATQSTCQRPSTLEKAGAHPFAGSKENRPVDARQGKRRART